MGAAVRVTSLRGDLAERFDECLPVVALVGTDCCMFLFTSVPKHVQCGLSFGRDFGMSALQGVATRVTEISTPCVEILLEPPVLKLSGLR